MLPKLDSLSNNELKMRSTSVKALLAVDSSYRYCGKPRELTLDKELIKLL